MIRYIHVYDLDGTLVDSLHRYRVTPDNRMDLDYWRQHEHLTPEDTLLPLADAYKADLVNPEVYVVIATARACEPGDLTYQYIDRHLGKPNKFIHRQGMSDQRKGAELKAKPLRSLRNLRQFRNAVIRIFEDNLDYLIYLSWALNGKPVYIPSMQGF